MNQHLLFAHSPDASLSQAIIEARQPFGAEIKQHIVEWFSGDTLDSIWTKSIETSGTIVMQDVIDGGLIFTTSTTSFDDNGLTFNNIEHYDHNGSAFIVVFRRITDNGEQMLSGLFGNNVINGTPRDVIYARDGSGGAQKRFHTSDASTGTSVDMDQIGDLLWTVYFGQVFPSHATMHSNGKLAVIKTTNLPSSKMQPYVKMRSTNTTISTTAIRYYEAWNI